VTPETAQLIPDGRPAGRAYARSWHAMPNNVVRSRRALLANLRDEHVAEPILDAIGMAVAEVTTNTVYHAYVGRHIGQFQIKATIDAGEITVSVEDDGSGFDNETIEPVGRGLTLVASLADRVETSRRGCGGTLTTMWFGA
jgi:anti-sigma regulatory factor (Ser/Thr protein kinase)